MKIGYWQFKPPILMTLLYLLIGGAMIALGLWQLERASEKIVMQQAADAAAAGPAIDLNELDHGFVPPVYTQVELKGRFEAGRQLLWDNRVFNGRAGFEVITPFRLALTDRLVLVNRGWVPLGQSRESLPGINITEAVDTQFTGVFTQPSIGFSSGDAVNLGQQGWPRILQHFDYAQIAEAMQEPVLSGLVQVVRPAEVGKNTASLGGVTLYPDNWQPVAFGPERHYGYAFQWFAMFVALSALYLFLNLKKLNLKETATSKSS